MLFLLLVYTNLLLIMKKSLCFFGNFRGKDMDVKLLFGLEKLSARIYSATL